MSPISSGVIGSTGDAFVTSGSTAVVVEQVTGGSFGASMGICEVAGTCAPVPDGATGSVLAGITDQGKELIQRCLTEGLSFRVTGFRVGVGGYDPRNPLNTTALDLSSPELVSPLWPVVTTDPEPIARYEQPNDNGISFLCRIPSESANAGLGEIGLYATILNSPLDSGENGSLVLFAIAHRPMNGKTLFDVNVWRIVTQF